ncbi:flavonol sulfotransferase-like [Euphorbia lathyris]|uniref:flavonol sulfotransferase-like n=1 Tax=Euphorbia lathyris TaxID=212925 RepID=UPI003313B1A0
MTDLSDGAPISTGEGDDEEINFSNLPQEPAWKVSVNLYKYQQFWCYDFALKGIIQFQQKFIPQPTDIFLATAPKSGTTWLKALAFAIHTRTQYINGDSDQDSPLLSKFPHEIVPVIEYIYLFGGKRNPQIPLLSTHVPFDSLPKSILNSDCKIIYLCRDPKDVLVSKYIFTSKHSDAEVIPFEEAYEKFCNGVTNCGPFWDQVMGYWKASLEFPERVLFLKYEELKKDTCFYVKKMADFMGCGFSEEEEKHGVVDKIVELCSFEKLSNLDVNKSSTERSDFRIANEAYFRKGKVGDWKNYLTTEMAERIDGITRRKFNGSGLYF